MNSNVNGPNQHGNARMQSDGALQFTGTPFDQCMFPAPMHPAVAFRAASQFNCGIPIQRPFAFQGMQTYAMPYMHDSILTSVASSSNTHIRPNGRRERTTYTATQIELLEQTFLHTRYPDTAIRTDIAEKIGVAEAKIQIWFKNRRAKSRSDKKEKSTDDNNAQRKSAHQDSPNEPHHQESLQYCTNSLLPGTSAQQFNDSLPSNSSGGVNRQDINTTTDQNRFPVFSHNENLNMDHPPRSVVQPGAMNDVNSYSNSLTTLVRGSENMMQNGNYNPSQLAGYGYNSTRFTYDPQMLQNRNAIQNPILDANMQQLAMRRQLSMIYDQNVSDQLNGTSPANNTLPSYYRDPYSFSSGSVNKCSEDDNKMNRKFQ